MTEPLAEVWITGFDGADLTAVYATEGGAKAAVLARFASHWTAEGVTQTAWTTYKTTYEQHRGRQYLCVDAHRAQGPTSNTGWFVQPIPIVAKVRDA